MLIVACTLPSFQFAISLPLYLVIYNGLLCDHIHHCDHGTPEQPTDSYRIRTCGGLPLSGFQDQRIKPTLPSCQETGDTGFEPVNAGVKFLCLTAWLIPFKGMRFKYRTPNQISRTVPPTYEPRLRTQRISRSAQGSLPDTPCQMPDLCE